MKKTLLTLLLCCTLLAGCGSTPPATNDAPVVIGLDDTFAPMGFKDDSDTLVGFDIDLANAVSEKIGRTFEFKSVDWNSVSLELETKKIDLIWNGMTITDERKEKMTISEPYFDDTQSIYVLDDSTIKGKVDLAEKVVGLQLGSSADIAFSDEPVAEQTKEIKKYAANVEAFLDLKSKRLDAIIVDSVVGDYYLSKQSGFKKLDDVIAIEYFGIGARKDDTDLIKQIDKAIVDLKEDGTYDEIFNKWFGAGNNE